MSVAKNVPLDSGSVMSSDGKGFTRARAAASL
jgi:hypothetical protein